MLHCISYTSCVNISVILFIHCRKNCGVFTTGYTCWLIGVPLSDCEYQPIFLSVGSKNIPPGGAKNIPVFPIVF